MQGRRNLNAIQSIQNIHLRKVSTTQDGHVRSIRNRERARSTSQSAPREPYVLRQPCSTGAIFEKPNPKSIRCDQESGISPHYWTCLGTSYEQTVYNADIYRGYNLLYVSKTPYAGEWGVVTSCPNGQLVRTT